MSITREEAKLELAMHVARQIFEKRGNHTEAHLSENELAAIILFALKKAANQ
jgi:hypothetical protein